MSFYDEMQNVAREVLSEFKQGSIIYQHQTPGDGPEDEPGEPTVSSHNIDGTVQGVKYKYVMNGQAIASDLQMTAPVDPDYIPTIDGFVLLDGSRYKIHQLLPKPAVGTIVAYTFILRK